MRRSIVSLMILATAGATAPAQAQAPAGTLVMALPADPRPVPYVSIRATHDADVADQLFLRLAGLGPTLRTTGDSAMLPELAERWHRIDSVTVEFTLAGGARWHDGVPVTSRDVLFTWRLIHEPALGVDQAPFALIDSITAGDAQHVTVHFRHPSAEQVYIAGFQLQPLPAHLLATIPADSIATSAFAAHPVGNGPFRFERSVPGQLYELRAVVSHFRGTPGLARLVFRTIPDGTARFTALLSGETDLMDNLTPEQATAARQRRGLRVLPVPSNLIIYLLFNSHLPGDPTRPHPILADVRVRRALALALDRRTIARTTFGSSTLAPEAIRSQAWNWLGPVPAPAEAQPAAARRLLAEAGWRDRDGDGILDRDGQPLELHIIYPGVSAPRSTIAVQAERMLRGVGVKAVLEPLDGPVWFGRRRAGEFDIDISAVNQDPTPMSLVQSWSCGSAAQAGSSNVAHWCDPAFDRLLAAADAQTNPVAGYRLALARMAEWRPAITVAAPINIIAVHARFTNVMAHPIKTWTDLWRWRVRPGAALPRDR